MFTGGRRARRGRGEREERGDASGGPRSAGPSAAPRDVELVPQLQRVARRRTSGRCRSSRAVGVRRLPVRPPLPGDGACRSYDGDVGGRGPPRSRLHRTRRSARGRRPKARRHDPVADLLVPHLVRVARLGRVDRPAAQRRAGLRRPRVRRARSRACRTCASRRLPGGPRARARARVARPLVVPFTRAAPRPGRRAVVEGAERGERNSRVAARERRRPRRAAPFARRGSRGLRSAPSRSALVRVAGVARCAPARSAPHRGAGWAFPSTWSAFPSTSCRGLPVRSPSASLTFRRAPSPSPRAGSGRRS
jgi:hypothetical protein